MKKIVLFFVLIGAAVCGALPVYDYPNIGKKHRQLRMKLMESVRQGNVKGMEEICRKGIELDPDDALWHYNLACALAHGEDQKESFAELELAILNGFRNVVQMRADGDLKLLKDRERFEAACARATELGNEPAPGKPRHVPAYAVAGSAVTLVENNIRWDYDHNLFHADVKLSHPQSAAAEIIASSYNGPAADKIRRWMKEGTASGNAGDLYFNRDSGHSPIVVTNFPFLTSISMEDAAKRRGLDRMAPNMMFDHPVFGNASLALKEGLFQRSLARLNITDADSMARLAALYLMNQFWVFPAHKDVSGAGAVDFLPAVAPYQLAVEGSSYMDKRFVNAALAVSAAFRPDTKKAVLRSGLLAPTLQWLFRSTKPGVNGLDDYLSPKAHPTAWRQNDIDIDALVEKAHALKPEEIPPVVALSLVNSTIKPIPMPVAGVDYPDIRPEVLAVNPLCTAMVLRGPDAVRSFLIKASPAKMMKGSRIGGYRWAVTHGDAEKVKIEPIGDAEFQGLVRVTIDRTSLETNRIDIACFMKSLSSTYGAPSFVSFTAVPLEAREYREGKIYSIDYTNPKDFYADPLIALPRNWKDVYRYEDDKCTGFDRYVQGVLVDSFTAKGERIVERGDDAKPTKTVKVKYVIRNSGVAGAVPELTYLDEE